MNKFLYFPRHHDCKRIVSSSDEVNPTIKNMARKSPRTLSHSGANNHNKLTTLYEILAKS